MRRRQFAQGTLSLVALALVLAAGAGEAPAGEKVAVAIDHYADAVIARIADLDLLRQRHPRLRGEFQFLPGNTVVRVPLYETWQTPAVILEKPETGRPRQLSVTIADGGRILHRKAYALGAVVRPKSLIPILKKKADIEPGNWKQTGPEKAFDSLVETAGLEPAPGSAEDAIRPPDIFHADVTALPKEILREADRRLEIAKITYPVVCDTNYPLIGSGHLALARQTRYPGDEGLVSVYISHKMRLYDREGGASRKWVKFLVEVPLDRAWLEGDGDRTIGLPPGKIRVHTTTETYRNRHILGEGQGGLAQLVQSMAVGEDGNIYYSNTSNGLVRFNVHTSEFQIPPIDFRPAIDEFLPRSDDIPEEVRGKGKARCRWGTIYSAIAANCGRIFYAPVMSSRSGNRFQFNGILSMPQDHWDDPAAFKDGLRLNAGSWPAADYSLYDSHPKPGSTKRKLGGMTAIDGGVILSPYIRGWGGPWWLKVDEDGNTTGFGILDGAMRKRLKPKKRAPWSAAGYMDVSYGTLVVTRANLHYLLTGRKNPDLKGTLTICFAPLAKICAEADYYREMAASSRGPSLAPAWIAISLPDQHGQHGKILGVAEYGYYFAWFDLNTIDKGYVKKTYLERDLGEVPVRLPIAVGLGPYGYAWAKQGDDVWLYIGGYTGLTRLHYSRAGKVNARFKMDRFGRKLRPRILDRGKGGGIKRFCYLIAGLDNRVFVTGHHTAARGGTAFSGGLMSFQTTKLARLQKLSYMSRCFSTVHLRGRVAWHTDGRPWQHLFIGGRGFVGEYATRLGGEQAPMTRTRKIFVYKYEQGGPPRDLYGFSLPPDAKGNVAYGDFDFSANRRFLVILQANRLLTFDLAQNRYVDGRALEFESRAPYIARFFRPTKRLIRTPDDRLMFYAWAGGDSGATTFFQVDVSPEGRLAIRPYLTLTGDAAELKKTFTVPRAFAPDLKQADGSYDLLLGTSSRRAEPECRVIRDFIRPRG